VTLLFCFAPVWADALPWISRTASRQPVTGGAFSTVERSGTSPEVEIAWNASVLAFDRLRGSAYWQRVSSALGSETGRSGSQPQMFIAGHYGTSPTSD